MDLVGTLASLAIAQIFSSTKYIDVPLTFSFGISMIHIQLLINPGQDIKIHLVHFILVIVVFS